MALKVWLPLNEDLHNQGISNVNITSSNSSIITPGKMGSCMKITSSTSLGYTPNFNTGSLSFGGWFKFNQVEIATIVSTKTYTSSANSPTGNLLGNSSYGGIGLIWTGNNYYTSGSFTSMSIFSTLRTGSVNQSTNSFSVPFDTWIHIFLTWNINTRTLSLYKDGEFKGSKTFSSFSDGVSRVLSLNSSLVYGGNGPGVSVPIYCNDIRIYDHCLSQAEIKEISKALVLHYPFNIGGLNLYKGGYSVWSDKNGHHPSGSLIFDTSIISLNDLRGKTLYFSYDYSVEGEKLNTSGSYSVLRYGIHNTLQYVDENGNNKTTYPFAGYLEVSGTGRAIQSYTVPASAQSITSLTAAIQPYNLPASNNNNIWYIKNVKLEIGGVTPYTNNLSDINQIYKIIDESGCGNHGSITKGLLAFNNNSIRYNACVDFNLTKIEAPLYLHEQEELSFSAWIKLRSHTGANIAICGAYFVIDGQKLAGYCYGKSPAGYCYGNTALPLNTWVHIAAVWSKTGWMPYINGKPDRASEYASTGLVDRSGYNTQIGLENINNNSRALDGYLSDLRIYTTALSADDIRQLYETSMKIDKNQNIHTFELNESIKSRELIAGTFITNDYSTKSYSPHNTYNNGELYFSGNCSAGSPYIKVNPASKTYYYDFTISVSAGNQVYIGFERYDVDKTSRSNQACVYAIAVKPTSDIVKQRYKGTINLATDGVNPTDTICLRILNGWSGSATDSTKIMTIHNMSLREVDSLDKTKILHTGLFNSDEFKEYNKAEIYKDGIVEAFEFIEK